MLVLAWKTPASPTRSLLSPTAMYITAIKSPKSAFCGLWAKLVPSLRLFGEDARVRLPERGDGKKGFILSGKQQVCVINRE